MGHWRHGICHCCKSSLLGLGLVVCQNQTCDRQFCLTLWFCSCALGQLQTRMKLNWIGSPLHGRMLLRSAFRIWFMATFVYSILVMGMLNIIAEIFSVEEDEGEQQTTHPQPQTPQWVSVLEFVRQCLSFAFLLVTLIATIRLRSYVRRKYRIPEAFCEGCEDFCCVAMCGPCTSKSTDSTFHVFDSLRVLGSPPKDTILDVSYSFFYFQLDNAKIALALSKVCQIAHHTADYDRYNAACCTETGLDDEAPEVI